MDVYSFTRIRDLFDLAFFHLYYDSYTFIHSLTTYSNINISSTFKFFKHSGIMIRASKHIIIVFYVSRYSLEIFDKSRSTETTSERII